MGFQETQHIQMDMYSRPVIVALSAQPPGVNELFVLGVTALPTNKEENEGKKLMERGESRYA